MGKRKKKRDKATDLTLNHEYLSRRVSPKFGKQKWIEFAEFLLNQGFTVKLYEARQTVSKYLTVIRDDKQFKVRFSDHKPILARESKGDCDFFVGVTNLSRTTTTQAIMATLDFFSPTQSKETTNE